MRCIVGRPITAGRSLEQTTINGEWAKLGVMLLLFGGLLRFLNGVDRPSVARRAGLDQAEIEAFSRHSSRARAAQNLRTKGFDTAAIMRAVERKSVGVLARYLETVA